MTENRLDVISVEPWPQRQQPSAGRREHLGIHFRCCHLYGYIYKNKEETAYVGRCPGCGKPLRVKISSDGSGSSLRIFST